jgi:penicillin amidase
VTVGQWRTPVALTLRGVAAAIAFVAAFVSPATAVVSSAVPVSTWDVRGLKEPGTVIIDLWGVSHIYAASIRDALFLQGYNAAYTRLWQIDLSRKRGLGLLAKDFGPSYVAQDRAARLFLYRGDMAREWAAYGPQAKPSAEAFVAGINAFVDEVLAGRRPLPIEFKIAGSRPDRWRAEDVVRIRDHEIGMNLRSEVARAQVACTAGLGLDRLRRKLEPGWSTKVPDGLDPCSINPHVLDDYNLATRSVTFARGADEPTMRDSETTTLDPRRGGSNAWAIAPAHSATGRAVLANDPHRALSVPSLRYVVHLDAPGLSLIGAGEPSAPGVAIGHNRHIAFGLTVFGIDQEDLYVYETDPENPDAYRYRGGFEPMTVVREAIEVKGEATPREVELRFTRHGPVLFIDSEHHRAFALRSVLFEPGTAPYFTASTLMTATGWSGFRRAMARWAAPPENLVYADVAGNIGWVAAGRAPVRPNWDGLLPVPGDGRYEWSGFLSPDKLPSVLNPRQGWFASANELNLPQGYPFTERRLGFEWEDASRITRLNEVLGSRRVLTFADSTMLQTDTYDVGGRRMANLLAPLRSKDANVNEALALLKAWDFRSSADSAGAALFEVWITKHLPAALIARAVPEAARAVIATGAFGAILDYLEHPDGALGPDPQAVRDEVLLESLRAAFEDVRQRLGPDVPSWAWGKLHHAQFEHALFPLADDRTQTQMTIGPLPMGGSVFNPAVAFGRPSDFRVVFGASYRMVLDVGNWDCSVFINSPGQSGDPFSTHYRDLAPLWAAGAYVPLLFSRAAVEHAAGAVTRLFPGR